MTTIICSQNKYNGLFYFFKERKVFCKTDEEHFQNAVEYIRSLGNSVEMWNGVKITA